MTTSRPLRAVVAGRDDFHEGRNHVFAHTDRTSRWWELILNCGHEVIRPVRYTENPSDKTYRPYNGRSSADALPAPKRVYCEECERTNR